MAATKPCIRCERPIDTFAKVCPWCNWDQAVLPPPRKPVEAAPPAADAAELENRRRQIMLLAGGFVVLLMAAFVVGSLKTKAEKETKPATQSDAAATPEPKGGVVTLVPVTSSALPAETPITSAPVASPSATGSTADRSDATALPSAEYAQAAARAKAERQATLADPRSIVGSPYEESQPRRSVERSVPMASGTSSMPGEPAPLPRRVARTMPVPESQPIPEIRVSRNATARLNLTIGPDGHVHEIEVIEPIPGEMQKLIEAVQNWRFRPATENGLPVAAHFSVDISFRANG